MERHCVWIAIVAILLGSTPALADSEDPIRQFAAFDIHAYNVGVTSLVHSVSMGSGMSVDFNLMEYLLVHAKVLGTYFEGFGVKGDIGLGMVFDGHSGWTDWSQVWASSSGGATYYGGQSGRCRYNSMHSVDLGVRQYALWVHKATWISSEVDDSRQFDTIGYFGYRYDFIPDQSVTIDQWMASVHGMVGYANQRVNIHDKDGEAIKVFDRGTVSWGAMACIKWYLFELEAGYYDSRFYLEASLVVPFAFVW